MKSQKAGLTYSPKPTFINRMIEVGSYYFFMSFGLFNIAAAEAEIGENIGISAEAGIHAQKALWHLRKSLELYNDLLISMEPLPVADSARQVLSSFAYDEFHRDLVNTGSSIDESRQWKELVAVARNIDPVGAVRLFAGKAAAVLPKLELIAEQLSVGKMDPEELHKVMTLYVNALLTGQYIAHFNRETRGRYSHLVAHYGVAASAKSS